MVVASAWRLVWVASLSGVWVLVVSVFGGLRLSSGDCRFGFWLVWGGLWCLIVGCFPVWYCSANCGLVGLVGLFGFHGF